MVIGYWAGTCHTLHSNRPFLQKEEENQQKSSCLGVELPEVCNVRAEEQPY